MSLIIQRKFSIAKLKRLRFVYRHWELQLNGEKILIYGQQDKPTKVKQFCFRDFVVKPSDEFTPYISNIEIMFENSEVNINFKNTIEDTFCS